ncbi:MAG TPA: transposase [Candidatus Methylomirabilis sp.]|nr:transposase [Candidatus Methylomirabilis sp.]
MARPLRIEYPGAVYHITARGNARAKIYPAVADRVDFLAILVSVIRKYHWLCHAYCLMDTHYHLLVETPEGNLSLGMRHLNGVYTQRFNRRHRRSGHVFQGRFKGILVDKEHYLLELARYIVLNPVRTGTVGRASAWPWSSYLETAGLRPAAGFLTADWILGCLGGKKSTAQMRYRTFVAEGTSSASPWRSLAGQVFLGEKPFVQRFTAMLTAKEQISEIPRQQRYAGRPALAEIFHHRRLGNKADRDRGIHQAHMHHGYTLKQIAEHLGLHYSTVSKAVDAVEARGRS